MFELTQMQALMVKQMRLGGTWRRVADKAAKEWPSKDIEPGNLLDGRELCYEAALVLGEDHREEPWA